MFRMLFKLSLAIAFSCILFMMDTSSYECRRIWAVVVMERWWHSCEGYGSTSQMGTVYPALFPSLFLPTGVKYHMMRCPKG
jgi:hypothetical protein